MCQEDASCAPVLRVHGMDEPHTTIPHLAVVPIRLSPKVPAPLRRSTSMRSPHLPVAGAIGSRVSSLRTTPHVPRTTPHPRQSTLITERGEQPKLLFIGRGEYYMTQPTLITERGEPPGLLFIGRGEYSMTQSALITERGEPPGLLFIGRGEYSTTQPTLITERGELPRYQGYSSSGEENTQ